MDLSSVVFSDPSPWPPIEIIEPNPRYGAAMLSNMGACNSEMSAISLYNYNSLITRNFFFEISECFHKISIVEMHHLNAFGELALLSGSDPRLWSVQNGRMQYWTPACNRYPTRIGAIVSNALAGELEAIKKYQNQLEWIRDCQIKAVLNRIIADEMCHVQIFRLILSELNDDPFTQSLDFKFPEDREPDKEAFDEST
ncbi:rubrerythrin family protein [Lachnospiraceae bacterium 54-53]